MTKKVTFMPGCSLPSYTPHGVEAVMEYLKGHYPNLSGVQKCCGKPTKAVGQAELFKERYAGLQADLDKVETEMLVVACQNCYLMTKEYSPNIEVRSIWELMPKLGMPEELKGKAKNSDVVFTLHDSCPTRNDEGILDGVRWILDELGYKYVEPGHTRENTRCCGFGGMIVPVNGEVAGKIMKRRVEECETDYIVAYCAACRQSMVKGGGKGFHLLDLIFGPVVMQGDEAPADVLADPMKAWANRWKSKQAIKKVVKK